MWMMDRLEKTYPQKTPPLKTTPPKKSPESIPTQDYRLSVMFPNAGGAAKGEMSQSKSASASRTAVQPKASSGKIVFIFRVKRTSLFFSSPLSTYHPLKRTDLLLWLFLPSSKNNLSILKKKTKKPLRPELLHDSHHGPLRYPRWIGCHGKS